MIDLVVLFLGALLVGTQSGKGTFWPACFVFIGAMAGFFWNWQKTNGYIGWFESAFVAYLGPMVLATIAGVIIGGAFLSQDSIFRKQNPK